MRNAALLLSLASALTVSQAHADYTCGKTKNLEIPSYRIRLTGDGVERSAKPLSIKLTVDHETIYRDSDDSQVYNTGGRTTRLEAAYDATTGEYVTPATNVKFKRSRAGLVICRDRFSQVFLEINAQQGYWMDPKSIAERAHLPAFEAKRVPMITSDDHGRVATQVDASKTVEVAVATLESIRGIPTEVERLNGVMTYEIRDVTSGKVLLAAADTRKIDPVKSDTYPALKRAAAEKTEITVYGITEMLSEPHRSYDRALYFSGAVASK